MATFDVSGDAPIPSGTTATLTVPTYIDSMTEIGEEFNATLTTPIEITGTGTNTSSATADLQRGDIMTQTSNADVTVQATVTQDTGLNLYVVDQFELTPDMEVLAAATSLLTPGLDLQVFRRQPYRLQKVYGSHTTRLLGGKASIPVYFPQPFFSNPAITTITTANHRFDLTGHGLLMHGDNTVPTLFNFDQYSVQWAGTVDVLPGFRSVVYFNVNVLGPYGSLVFWFASQQISPLEFLNNAESAVAFGLEVEQDRVVPRAWIAPGFSNPGYAESTVNYSLGHISQFQDRLLVAEVEIDGSNDMQTRFYDPGLDLTTPLAAITLPAPAPFTVDRLSVTSLGKLRWPDAPTNRQAVTIRYMDVEQNGPVYDASTGVDLSDAKFRPAQDRVPLELLNVGPNTVFTVLSDDGVTTTETADDTIRLVLASPTITLVSFLPASPVLVPGTSTPPVVKGSLQPGYEAVEIKFTANQAGTWTLRVNSTSETDGLEIASGTYETPGAEAVAAFGFGDLPQVDDIYDVTLYLIAESGRPASRRLNQYILP